MESCRNVSLCYSQEVVGVHRSLAADFRHELARILSSLTFSKAEKQRDLLKWLGEQALTGGPESFSQYAIATNALGYPGDYDSSSDSRVRIAVRRLRERLIAYYQNEGRLNRFRIAIDEGQYEPRLVLADLSSRPRPASVLALSERVSILVLPVLPIGFTDDGFLCEGLTLNLMRALAASGQARIVPWATAHWLAARTADKREHHLQTGADVILETLVRRTSDTRRTISVQWVDGPTGLLDSFYEFRGGEEDTLSIIDDLVAQLAQRLSITYDERTHLQVALRHSFNPAALTFYLRARRDALVFNPPGIRRAFEFVAHALKQDPHFAAAHALQAELHLAVGDAGGGPASLHAPMAREAAERALRLAPELGDALAARGAIQLTYDWDLPAAAQTLSTACADPLAEAAPHWPPILDLAQGKNEEAAGRFEKWARLDPGNGAKAAIAAEFWYYARQFDLGIRWGMKALELDGQNLRAGLLVAASHIELGRIADGLRIARRTQESAPDFCETNLILAALLARANQVEEARQVVNSWNQRKNPDIYEPPIMYAIVHAWLGETSRALEAMYQVVLDRQTVCLFARSAPYLAPLHGQREFEHMLSHAGILAVPRTGTDQ
jgi:TolB-like protein